MHERLLPILKIVCLALAALVIFELAHLAGRRDFWRSLKPPARLAAIGAVDAGSADPAAAADSKTNSAAPAQAVAGPAGIVGQMPPVPGARPPAFPKKIQTELDWIDATGILGPRPMPIPMGLLGVAGDYALLRAPGGQAGLLKIGESLGGVKLLEIGANRVVVEEAGRKQELIIFSGLGSAPLLRGGKEHPQ